MPEPINDPFSDDDPQPPAKRRPGRPRRPMQPLADTFEKALADLLPRHQQFVRYVLQGNTFMEAYSQAADAPITSKTAQVEGSKLAARVLVAHALKLGKQVGAVQAMSGIEYDVCKAMAELLEGMAFAKRTENATAFMRAVELRSKLFRLIDAASADGDFQFWTLPG